jgi:hypothetical protein
MELEGLPGRKLSLLAADALRLEDSGTELT